MFSNDSGFDVGIKRWEPCGFVELYDVLLRMCDLKIVLFFLIISIGLVRLILGAHNVRALFVYFMFMPFYKSIKWLCIFFN